MMAISRLIVVFASAQAVAVDHGDFWTVSARLSNAGREPDSPHRGRLWTLRIGWDR